VTQIDLEDVYDRQFDGVALVTPHDEFESIRWADMKQPDGDLIILDGRNALNRDALPDDCRVYTIGIVEE